MDQENPVIEERLDKINLLEYLESHIPTDKVLYSRIIQDAVASYLNAFVTKSYISVDEFFSSWKYLFKIVSTDKKTWDFNRTIRSSHISNGLKVIERRYLEDEELKLMCFDKHYEFSGLAKYMYIDKFRSSLKDKRTKLLNDNWNQVEKYINGLYQKELNQVADNRQLPLQLWNNNLLSTLVDPPSPIHLASVVYIPKKLKKEVKARTNKQTSSKHSKLIERIKSNDFQPISNNWGPLATSE